MLEGPVFILLAVVSAFLCASLAVPTLDGEKAVSSSLDWLVDTDLCKVGILIIKAMFVNFLDSLAIGNIKFKLT